MPIASYAVNFMPPIHASTSATPPSNYRLAHVLDGNDPLNSGPRLHYSKRNRTHRIYLLALIFSSHYLNMFRANAVPRGSDEDPAVNLVRNDHIAGHR